MELTNLRFEISTWPLILAKIEPGQKVSRLIVDAGVDFAIQTGKQPEFAFVNQLPAGAEEFVDVKGITLVLAAWVPTGYVAVGRGATQDFDKEYRKWIKK